LLNRRTFLNVVSTMTALQLLSLEGTNAQGGPTIELTLRVEIPPQADLSSTLFERTLKVLTDRAEMLPGVQVTTKTPGNDFIVMTLTGVSDQEVSISTITERGWVEFIDPLETFLEQGTVVTTSGSPTPWPRANGLAAAATPIPVYQTIITSDDIVESYLYTDQFEQLSIGFRLNPRAAEAFSAHTSQNVGLPMSIVVDNVVVNSAVMMAAMTDSGLIQGLEEAQAKALAIQLSVTPLPTRVELIAIA
jgi:preprotein translocase subunit SecD